MLERSPDAGLALQDRDSRFRMLADSAPVLLWVSDAAGRCTFFNQQWLTFTGRTLEQELGSGWMDSMHPDDAARNIEIFSAALAARTPFRMEYRLRRADGVYRLMLDTGVPRSDPDGSFAGYIGSCVDITERFELATALEQKSLEQEALLMSMPALVYYKDRALRYVTVNQAFADMVRLSAEAIAGKTDFDLFEPDDAAHYRRVDLAVLEDGRPQLNIEERLTAPDGRVLWFTTHKTPYRDPAGNIAGLVGISTDISARKQAEEQLRDQTETLATLNRIGSVLAAELDLEPLLQAVVDAARDLTGAQLGVFVYSSTDELGERQLLSMRAGSGFAAMPGAPDNRRALAAAAAQLRHLCLVEDMRAIEHGPEHAAAVALLGAAVAVSSLLALPVVSRAGETIGALVVGHPEPGRFATRHGHLLSSLAAQAAVAVDNARLYQAEALARRLAERAGERIRRMNAITTALSEAMTPRQVGEVILDQALATMAAPVLLVGMLTADGAELEIINTRGYDQSMFQTNQRYPIDTRMPLADVVRSGQPVWMETTEQRCARYPHLAADYAAMSPVAWVSLPFTIEGRSVGGLSLGFETLYHLTDDDKAFLLAFGRQCGLALERARLYDAERAARRAAEAAELRLAFLAEASSVLGASLEYQRALRDVVQLVSTRLAEWCWIDLWEHDAVPQRLVSTAGPLAQPEERELIERLPLVVATDGGPAEVLRTGRAQLYAELPDNTAADDEWHAALRALRACSAMCVPIRSREHLLGVMTVVSIRPERRYAAADLALLEDVGRRAGTALENARLYNDAQEAIQMRDDFLSIASHELKTPITSLQLQAQGILRLAQKGGLASLPPDRLVAKLSVIDAQTTRLTSLANELLDVARIRAGRVDLGLEDLDLAQVARDVAGRFDEQAALTGASITVEAPSALRLWSDRARLEQVLTNLLSNALKYGAGKPVELVLDASETAARISVRDQGIGIAPEHLERIFVRYERLVSPRNYGGLGLGLYIVRQIVEALGGSIRVTSEVGQGSTFVVTLPRIDAQR